MRRLVHSFWTKLIFALVCTGLATLAASHAFELMGGQSTTFPMAVMFIGLATTLVMAMAHKAIIPAEVAAKTIKNPIRIAVVIPAYNEDPHLLARAIDSIREQTLIPWHVRIVDDGSTNGLYFHPRVREAVDNLRYFCPDVMFLRQENAGKRHAQIKAFRHLSEMDFDVYVTMDSDTVLDKRALYNLTLPFYNSEVMSVAGTAYGINHKRSLLTRTIELGFSMSFLNGRAAEASAGAVRVNCGMLAGYRRKTVDQNLGRYTSQKFLGQPCLSGDDRALTMFAREMGRCEFQPTAVGYTAHPVKLSHLVRQRLRWAKSWYWGTWWLLSRPLSKAEFWLTLFQVFGMVAYLCLVITIGVLLSLGQVSWLVIPAMVSVAMLINAISSMRYITQGRKDVSRWDRILTWLTSPLNTLLFMFVLNPLYWVAAFQLKKNQWGTRKKVEVGLEE